MVDRDLVRRRLVLLDQYLAQLAPYAALSLAEYESDWKTQRVVERTLHLSIETCMDLADHVIADRKLRVPDTGAEAFEILAEAQVLPAELGRSLATMVGFRNILVHDYAKLDPAVVLRVLGHDVQDLVRFRDLLAGVI